MKIIVNILIILVLNVTTSCGLKNTNSESNQISIGKIFSKEFNLKSFKPLPKEYAYNDRAFLIDKIKPSSDFTYWECVYKDVFAEENRGHIIVCNGDSTNYSYYARKVNSENGFFVECHPGVCFSYIVGVHSDKSIELIDSEDKLRLFIGNIDNIEEAILTAKINNYWYDTDTIIGGAYKELKNEYLMYLLDYSSTPVTYKSVKAVLTKKGEFSVIDKTTYKETDEYIME